MQVGGKFIFFRELNNISYPWFLSFYGKGVLTLIPEALAHSFDDLMT